MTRTSRNEYLANALYNAGIGERKSTMANANTRPQNDIIIRDSSPEIKKSWRDEMYNHFREVSEGIKEKFKEENTMKKNARNEFLANALYSAGIGEKSNSSFTLENVKARATVGDELVVNEPPKGLKYSGEKKHVFDAVGKDMASGIIRWLKATKE